MKSHEGFRAKMEFPFPLLSDADEKLCSLFGVIKMKNMYGKQVRGIERSTFVIDGNGVVAKEWRGVKVRDTRPRSSSSSAPCSRLFLRTPARAALSFHHNGCCRALTGAPIACVFANPRATMAGKRFAEDRLPNRRPQGGSWSSARSVPRP
jgi:hypothetical protein